MLAGIPNGRNDVTFIVIKVAFPKFATMYSRLLLNQTTAFQAKPSHGCRPPWLTLFDAFMKKQIYAQAKIRMAYNWPILFCVLLTHTIKAQNLQFAKSFPNTVPLGGIVEGRSIRLDGAGNRYVVGSFQNTADFDPGAGTQYLNSAGNYDIFLTKYDASGNYLWAVRIGGIGNDQAYALAVDASGNSTITGYFTGTVDFDPGTGTQNFSSVSNTSDVFLAKYDASGN